VIPTPDQTLAVLEEITRFLPRARKPGEFNFKEYKDAVENKTGIRPSDSGARKQLEILVGRGKLVREENVICPPSSQPCIVWRKPEEVK
jgi:hypothetical protein